MGIGDEFNYEVNYSKFIISPKVMECHFSFAKSAQCRARNWTWRWGSLTIQSGGDNIPGSSIVDHTIDLPHIGGHGRLYKKNGGIPFPLGYRPSIKLVMFSGSDIKSMLVFPRLLQSLVDFLLQFIKIWASVLQNVIVLVFLLFQKEMKVVQFLTIM